MTHFQISTKRVYDTPFSLVVVMAVFAAIACCMSWNADYFGYHQMEKVGFYIATAMAIGMLIFVTYKWYFGTEVVYTEL